MRLRAMCGIAFTVGMASATAASPETFIVRRGVPAAEIVVASARPRMVGLAVLELQSHIEKISGARLPIVTTPTGNGKVGIYVGRSVQTDQLGITDEGLKDGAFRMVSGPNRLVLLGRDSDYAPPKPWPHYRNDQARAQAEWDRTTEGVAETKWGYPFHSKFKLFWTPREFDRIFAARYGSENKPFWNPDNLTWKRGDGPGLWLGDEGGSLNAVYAFLRTLGVRWYMPTEFGTVIPKLESIQLPTVERTVRPDFAMRAYFWYNYAAFPFEHIVWARRTGMNSIRGVLGEIGHAHGLVHVHKRREMKDAHPEYYALIGGKRDTEHRGYGTACYSSEGLVKEAAAFARFVFDRYDQPHVSLWPTDGFKQCECEGCQGKTPSELVWAFVDRVARDLYKTHPDRLITCGAYTPYSDPPDSITTFSPNVGVFISNCGRPLMTDPHFWEFYWTRIEAWRKRLAPGRILRVENNRYGLSRTFPVIHPHGMAKDLAALRGVSLGECDEEAQEKGRWHSPGFDHLTLYVQSRFLWDATQDVDALLEEYYTLFYGPVREQMKAALEFAENAYVTADRTRHRRKTSAGAVGLPERIRFTEMLLAARDEADDTIYGQRIQQILDELPDVEGLRHALEAQRLAGDPRNENPVAVGHRTERNRPGNTYRLRHMTTGKPAEVETTFQVSWDKDTLVFNIHCQEPDMENLFVTRDVWGGDSIAVLLETPSHTYYQIEVSPDGALFDADREHRVNARWQSLAKVETKRGADFWTVTLRIPVVDDEAGHMDPNHNVVGALPTSARPWHFNVGRTRVRNDQRISYMFSPTGTKTYHELSKFAKLEIK